MGIILLIASVALLFTKLWIIGVIVLILLAVFARGEFWYTVFGLDVSELVELLSEIDWSDIDFPDINFD